MSPTPDGYLRGMTLAAAFDNIDVLSLLVGIVIGAIIVLVFHG